MKVGGTKAPLQSIAWIDSEPHSRAKNVFTNVVKSLKIECPTAFSKFFARALLKKLQKAIFKLLTSFLIPVKIQTNFDVII